MLRLLVKDSHAQEATIPVRWCLSRELMEELKEENAKNPHLLIVVWNKSKRKERRYLAPIEQILQFVQFPGPDENIISAMVVWGESGKYADLHDELLTRGRHRYSTDLLTYGDGKMTSGALRCRTLGSDSVSVFVQRELFAKEPPAWEKKWVNLWFSSKPVDQCDYRKPHIRVAVSKPQGQSLQTLRGLALFGRRTCLRGGTYCSAAFISFLPPFTIKFTYAFNFPRRGENGHWF